VFVSRVAQFIGFIAMAAWVTGCAETQFVSHTVKSVEPQQKSKSGPPAQTGAFKVGKPYQIEGVWYYPQEDYAFTETGIASWYGPDFHGKPTANGEVFDMNELTAAHRTLQLPSLVRVTNLDNGRSLVVRVNDRGPFARGRIIDLSRRAAQLLGFEQSGTAKVNIEVLGDESRRLASLAKRMPGADDEPVKAAPAGTVTVEALPAAGGGVAAPSSASTSGAVPASSSKVAAASAAPIEAAPAPTGQVSVASVKPTGIFVQAGAFTSQSNAERLSISLAGVGPTQIVQVRLGAQTFYRVRIGPAINVEDADRMLERVAAAGFPEARLVVD
jgi:rare lipoprotein A